MGLHRRGAAATLALLFVSTPLAAQDSAPPARDAGAVTAPLTGSVASDLAELPAASRTRHELQLPNRTLRFTAIAGAHELRNQQGRLLAEVGYTAYVLDGPQPADRPVIFAFNGGPGAASTWLHLGAMGPWRLPLTVESITHAGRPSVEPNAETWLDFADLVFLDPPGTGVTRVRPAVPKPGDGEDRRREVGGPDWFWSMSGDIDTFVEVIRSWPARMERPDRPIVLVGESYGGFRAPIIAAELMARHRLSVSSLILVSPVLDFDGRRMRHQPQHYVAMLPSLAATRMQRSGLEPNRETLASIERYARGDYLADLMRGVRDTAAIDRLSVAVAEMTGLSTQSVRNSSGRVSASTFVRASPLFAGDRPSLYDAGLAGLPAPAERRRRFADPFTSGLSEPLSGAMTDLLGRLEWPAKRPYLTLANEVNWQWRWQRGPSPPEALSSLQSVMATNARATVLVTHGFTDLVTPYFASVVQLDQLSLPRPEGRMALEVYPGGHMFYSRDASRARFRADAERAIKAAQDQSRPRPDPARETP